MKKFRFAVVLIFTVSLLLLSCSDDPNDVGLGLLPLTDALKIDSVNVVATSDTSFLFRNTGSSPKLMLGNYDNGTGQRMKAKIVLQYGGILSVPPGSVVDSAVLKLTMDYRFKNSSGTFGFKIHEMISPWSEATFTWDSANVSGAFQTIADTSFLQNITANDSTVSVRVDTLVNDWIRNNINVPNGIILIPDSISTNIILGARNDDALTAPRLTIWYHDTTTADTTHSFWLLPNQSMYISDGDIPSSSSLRYLQSGVAYREIMRFDSISHFIPSKAIITQAIFEVAGDISSSITNSYSHDSLIVYLVRDNTSPYTSLALGTLCEPALSGAQKVYRSDIKGIVQQWTTNFPNYGIVLKTYNETASFDRLALHGANAAPTLRPKLKILYTILP